MFESPFEKKKKYIEYFNSNNNKLSGSPNCMKSSFKIDAHQRHLLRETHYLTPITSRFGNRHCKQSHLVFWLVSRQRHWELFPAWDFYLNGLKRRGSCWLLALKSFFILFLLNPPLGTNHRWEKMNRGGQNEKWERERGGGSSSRFSYNTDWHDPVFSTKDEVKIRNWIKA